MRGSFRRSPASYHTSYSEVSKRKFKTVLVTLAASATILLPAGSTAATTQSTSNVPLSSPSGCVFLCFDLLEDDVVVGHDVDIITAALWCGYVSHTPLQSLGIDQTWVCGIPHRKVRRIR
jgi:hypothetical protein